jgi:hypothetical protein
MAGFFRPPSGQPTKAEPVPVFYRLSDLLSVRRGFLVACTVHFSTHPLGHVRSLTGRLWRRRARGVRSSLRNGPNGRIVRCRALDAGWRSHRVLCRLILRGCRADAQKKCDGSKQCRLLHHGDTSPVVSIAKRPWVRVGSSDGQAVHGSGRSHTSGPS